MTPDLGATDTAGEVGGSTGRPILVVDDDAKILRLVRTYLERDGHAVVTAADGIAALSASARYDPELVVLDLMLPELDGLAVLRELHRVSTTPVIIVSARGMTGDRIAGLEDGADDYLPKPFSPAELVARVRAVLRRTREYLPPDGGRVARDAGPAHAGRGVLRHVDLVLDTDRYELRRGGELIALTLAEFRLLAALLDADGRVLTRDQLLDAVYGQDQADVLDRTIDVHIGRLRDKLGDDADRPRYVATVRGIGYRAAPEGPVTDSPGPPGRGSE